MSHALLFGATIAREGRETTGMGNNIAYSARNPQTLQSGRCPKVLRISAYPSPPKKYCGGIGVGGRFRGFFALSAVSREIATGQLAVFLAFCS